jgi:hypothetical protein
MADEPEDQQAWMAPPLLEEAAREGKNPIEYLLTRQVLGVYLWLVPLRLMPYRSGAAMIIGTLVAYEPEDICDLRVRTIEGEPYWVFASTREPRPDKSPFARLGKPRKTNGKKKAKRP